MVFLPLLFCSFLFLLFMFFRYVSNLILKLIDNHEVILPGLWEVNNLFDADIGVIDRNELQDMLTGRGRLFTI